MSVTGLPPLIFRAWSFTPSGVVTTVSSTFAAFSGSGAAGFPGPSTTTFQEPSSCFCQTEE